MFSGIYRIWVYLFCSNTNFYGPITAFSANTEFPQSYDKLHSLRIELLETEKVIVLDALSKMAFYCCISFYFCTDIFQNTFTVWLPKQLLSSFISLGLCFFGFWGQRAASSFESIPLVPNHWHYLTAKNHKSTPDNDRTRGLIVSNTGIVGLWAQRDGAKAQKWAMQLLHPSGNWHWVFIIYSYCCSPFTWGTSEQYLLFSFPQSAWIYSKKYINAFRSVISWIYT